MVARPCKAVSNGWSMFGAVGYNKKTSGEAEAEPSVLRFPSLYAAAALPLGCTSAV
jgi:hypothetical protein